MHERSAGRYRAVSVSLGMVAVSVLCLFVGTSGASTAPRLTPHRDYVATTPHFRVSFISHSATVIDAALAGLGGSQYVEGSVLTNCPGVSPKALTSPGYPRIVLKLVHGVFSFSLSYSVANVEASYPGQASKTLPSAHVHLTGRVESASVIVGTVQLSGAPCTTPTYAYRARIDPAFTSEISPDA
jgi:hypothetical protein